MLLVLVVLCVWRGWRASMAAVLLRMPSCHQRGGVCLPADHRGICREIRHFGVHQPHRGSDDAGIRGQGRDPMQASECGYNTKYPNTPGGITDPVYSIDCGVHELTDCLKAANVQNPADLEHIKLALQGYNYGAGYISWALRKYGGYSPENALRVFRDEESAVWDVGLRRPGVPAACAAVLCLRLLIWRQFAGQSGDFVGRGG